MNRAADILNGARLLIVEDEYLLAQEMADYFENLGTEVVGPVGTVARALDLIASSRIQVAVLDVNLRDERVYPVAEALTLKQIPFCICVRIRQRTRTGRLCRRSQVYQANRICRTGQDAGGADQIQRVGRPYDTACSIRSVAHPTE